MNLLKVSPITSLHFVMFGFFSVPLFLDNEVVIAISYIFGVFIGVVILACMAIIDAIKNKEGKQ